MSPTKGEVLISGIDRIREGLDMISGLGAKQDLIKTMVGSQAAANKLRDLVKSNIVFQNTVIAMVAARNSRLSPDTVEKVVTDFLDVLFDLSQPYKQASKDEVK